MSQKVKRTYRARSYVVQVYLKDRPNKQPMTESYFQPSPEAKMEEIIGLCAAIELDIQGSEQIRLTSPAPSTFIKKGNVERIATIISDAEIDLVIVDTQLSPIQQRNLEREWKCKVIDRTALILEIFGARARTAEGRLQVELASLSYQRSRLVRSWTHLERQRGGYGFLGGPGESQIEMDRRLIDNRIIKIKKDLEQIKRTRGLHRQSRRRVPYPIVALVGYTNAGKSTLFNKLTKSKVFAKDLLFATLDPTMRQLTLPSGKKCIVSDTVGFIADLPTQLISAFQATLEEVQEAHILLHVRDSSHPDNHIQARNVYDVLKELNISIDDGDQDFIEIFNKIDLLPAEDKELYQNKALRQSNVICLSAITGEGIPTLISLLEEQVAKFYEKHSKG